MKKFLTIRIWILLFFLFMSLLAISPRFDKSGVEIAYTGKDLREQGLLAGDIIKAIDGIPIKNLDDFGGVFDRIEVPNREITVETDKKAVKYEPKGELGFEVKNLTIINSKITGISEGDKLVKIDEYEINSDEDLLNKLYDILPYTKLKISTERREFNILITKVPVLKVTKVSGSNIKKGLDLEGGAKVILKPDHEISEENISSMMRILANKINVYGLRDMKLRQVSDNLGNKYVSVELAGATRDEIEEVVAKQGKFEAKIGDQLVFTGEKRDIRYVCREDGSCAGIRGCSRAGNNEIVCRFEFKITLSEDAAKRHAEITKNLDVIYSDEGGYLNETIDLYLDERMISDLQISKDLKGSVQQDILISGPGRGKTQEEAMQNAVDEMNKLQTVLITGSLPFKLNIVSLEEVSPIMGEQFLNNALKIGLLAFIAVLLVILIRYRQIKIIIPIGITLLSELFIILGFAALFKWNLDLPAIAGIIASIGTGVDDQIVITDELLKGEKEALSWKQRIKRAFGIILIAYFTTAVAMLPLWNAAAGALRGFALTTIIGISIGVFVTRPAFASMMEKILQ